MMGKLFKIMGKLSKKKQARLDFLEKKYKVLLNIHHLVDRYSYGKMNVEDCLREISKEVYRTT